jgi:type II secretory pathway predicted ATPase ExeA
MTTVIKDLRSHFGFHTTPFTRELPLAHRFPLDTNDEALQALIQAIENRMSCALIAPAGSGKTTLLRALVDLLPQARYRVHYVKVTNLSKRDFCREIAAALGLEPVGTYATLVRRVDEHFLDIASTSGLRPVLILDEGHEIRTDVLGVLRILTNFEMDSRLVVSIVLAGQPPLRANLRREDLEDVARRLAHIATLRNLSREESHEYVAHRCRVAGAKTVPFDKLTLDAIFEIACGNLRATDSLGLGALQVAFSKSKPVVDQAHVVEARSRLWP